MKKFKFKKYEEIQTTRYNFKKRCHDHKKNYYDYDEVYTGIKNKSGNKLFNYFFKGSNQGEQEEIKNKKKSIEYYETHSITISNFKRKCEITGKKYNHFKRIYSGEKINNNKKYYYKYVGKKVPQIKEYRHSINHYETFSITSYRFKEICKKRNWNYDFFEEIDSGQFSGGSKKYYYKYVGKKVPQIKEYRHSINHYETFSITSYRFKEICKKRNWNYDFFEEIDSGQFSGGNKKYYYKYVGKNSYKIKEYSYSMKYYETFSITSYRFKEICKRKNWNYDFFKEIDSGQFSGGSKKYYYKYIGRKVLKISKYRYSINHYETFSITLYRFKEICKKRGYKFEDFEQIESGEKIGASKKFFYKLKNRKFLDKT